MPKMHNSLDLDRIMEACEMDDNIGFCTACGAERDGCEPDARKYHCDECGADKVYGAPELLLMLA